MNKEDGEVKPCPLCNKEVRIVDFGGYEILCECGVIYSAQDDISRENTIKQWNIRDSHNQALDEIKELAVALGRNHAFIGEEYEEGYYQCRLEILEGIESLNDRSLKHE